MLGSQWNWTKARSCGDNSDDVAQRLRPAAPMRKFGVLCFYFGKISANYLENAALVCHNQVTAVGGADPRPQDPLLWHTQKSLKKKKSEC